MTTFRRYQEFIEATNIYKDPLYPILGLAEETGEFIELVKKVYREAETDWPDHIDISKATLELGDIFWYLTRIASLLGISLETIIEQNIDKLTKRGNIERAIHQART